MTEDTKTKTMNLLWLVGLLCGGTEAFIGLRLVTHLFSLILVLVFAFTTFLTPPVLGWLVMHNDKADEERAGKAPLPRSDKVASPSEACIHTNTRNEKP